MPLAVIPGSFRLIGTSPDGDSVRFFPDDPQAFSKAKIAAKLNAAGGAQLRLDAIDALETHYTPPGAPHAWRQPPQFADAAASRVLELLGFTSVTRSDDNIVTASEPAQTAGYILTRFADTYGRPVSLVYAGTRAGPTDPDGTAYIDVAEMRESANYQLLAAGLVYPTFYSKLYVDFRDALAAAAVAARDSGTGLWPSDATLPGFTLTSVDQLTGELVILPKLFRRLAEYLNDAGDATVDLTGFNAFLNAHNDDQLYTVPAGQATNLDTLLAITKDSVRLTLPPEQIVFLET